LTFLCDEGVEPQVVRRLREDGHQVFHIAEQYPGISDDRVLAEAHRRSAVLITLDKDFGELIFRSGSPHAGVVLVRLPDALPKERAAAVSAFISKHAGELPGSFAVLSFRKVRIRRMGA
jgi:predicted nuclease of predicted toxin-antitoxin system